MNEKNRAIELRMKVEDFLKYADDLAKRAKQLQKVLYKQLDEVKEVEMLDNVNPEFLDAYLLWKSIKRANYQPEHLKLTSFNRDKLLDTIETEVNNIEENNQKQLAGELSEERLLIRLGAEIQSEGVYNKEGNYQFLYFLDSKGKEIALDLSEGKLKSLRKLMGEEYTNKKKYEQK